MLQEAIGTSKMDANSLMKYFQPVIEWLEKQNVNETLGWPDFNWVPPVPEGYPEDIGEDWQHKKNVNFKKKCVLIISRDSCAVKT